MTARSDGMNPDLDRRVFGDSSYGLYIVTSRDGDQMNGQIVNTVIQVTTDPPRVAVIINKKNLTHGFISNSRVFGVTVLDEATPMKFLGPFGFRSGRDVDNAVNSEVLRESRPLTYQYYRESLKGKSPPNAPTYTPSKQAGKSKNELK
jgi:flavin reductase (DIM6/NTAB) family NADH-FMN oxidoreductase RutF